MNKAEVVRKVSHLSDVPEETCAAVLKAFEKVMEEELSAKGSNLFGKISGFFQSFGSGSGDD